MVNPFEVGYYTESDLKDAGFKSLGKNIRIAKNCTIMGLCNISIGNNVIIDAYCTIVATGKGLLEIGSFVHIGGYCLLSAGDGIILEDFSGLSQGVKIYSRTDDYTGKHLTNPTIADKYTGVVGGVVVIKQHVIIGAQSIILPNVTIGKGSSVGALSLVSTNLASWGVFCGYPLRRLKSRSKHLLKLRKMFLQEYSKESGYIEHLNGNSQ